MRHQLTLALLKPDITMMPTLVNHVREAIIRNDFKVVRSKTLKLSRADAERFYKEHQGKFFYNRLVTFMSSGPIHAHILYKENAINDWRELMGPTKVFKTRYEQPDTLRGSVGLTDTRNTFHGSDSEASAEREIKFFFPDFNLSKFYAEEETHFRKGNIQLDSMQFVHMPNITTNQSV